MIYSLWKYNKEDFETYQYQQFSVERVLTGISCTRLFSARMGPWKDYFSISIIKSQILIFIFNNCPFKYSWTWDVFAVSLYQKRDGRFCPHLMARRPWIKLFHIIIATIIIIIAIIIATIVIIIIFLYWLKLLWHRPQLIRKNKTCSITFFFTSRL